MIVCYQELRLNMSHGQGNFHPDSHSFKKRNRRMSRKNMETSDFHLKKVSQLSCIQSLSNPLQTSKELYGFTAGSQGMDLPQLDPCLGCCKVPTYRWIRWDISMGFPWEKYDKYGLWIHSMRSLHRRGRTRSPMFTFGSSLSGIR